MNNEIEHVTSLVDKKDVPFWRRAYDAIFAESIEDVKKSVVKDIVIPRIRDFFFDLVTGSVERSIYGSTSSYSRSYGGNRSAPVRPYKASYEPYYNRSTSVSEVNDELYEPIILDTRAKAEKVYYIMVDQIVKHRRATINDLNSCVVDKEGNSRIGKSTDPNWGWTYLPERPVIRPLARDMYQLIMPEPIELIAKEKKYYDV